VAEEGAVHVDEDLKDRKQSKGKAVLEVYYMLTKLGRGMKISAVCSQSENSFHNSI
jgi:hypothetical protein